MKNPQVKSLFNASGERRALMRDFGKATVGRGFVALISGLYAVWLTACCSGPAALLYLPGDTEVLWELPPWMGPLLAMAVASTLIAARFRATRHERRGQSWLVVLASVMTLGLAVHLVWALSPGLPPVADGSLYVVSTILTGVGAAYFRVEIDRVFGYLGTQQTLYLGMTGVLVTLAVLMGCIVFGSTGDAGLGLVVLCGVGLPLPFLLAWLLWRVVNSFPQTRFYGHGQDTPLPFPTKFVVTSGVQGMASGCMFAFLFMHRGMANPMSADVLIGQAVGVLLLFGTLAFFRLDFNRFIYKVAFSFVAFGFIFVAVGWGGVGTGIVVLAAGFCYLDLVLWSLGACLIKNMGLPAPWVASCPGAALFFGAVIGGFISFAAMDGVPFDDVAPLGSFVACFMLAMALYLSSGDNLKYGWGTVLPGESGLETSDLTGTVRFMATERGVTQRETEVMELLVAGKTRREICEELMVSPDTVKTHVRSVYRKLGVHSQQELIDRVVTEQERLMLGGDAEDG